MKDHQNFKQIVVSLAHEPRKENHRKQSQNMSCGGQKTERAQPRPNHCKKTNKKNIVAKI